MITSPVSDSPRKFLLFLLCTFFLFTLPESLSVSAASISPFRFDYSAETTILGFALRNEIIPGYASKSSTAAVFNFDIDTRVSYKNAITLRLRLLGEGQSRYGLLLGDSKEVLYGKYDATHRSDLVPLVDLLNLTMTTPGKSISGQFGLVRSGTTDKYSNPGANLSFTRNRFRLALHYSDVGKRRSWFCQPKKLAETPPIPDQVKADYWVADVSYFSNAVDLNFQIHYLHDTTPPNKRWNRMQQEWGDIIEDKLGIYSVSGAVKLFPFRFRFSVMKNFGKSLGVEDEFKYTGMRWDGNLIWEYGLYTCVLRYFFASGNPWKSPPEALDPAETSGRNFKGFAFIPPTDYALVNSHYRVEDGPPVLMGSKLTPYYGFPRPSDFNDAYLMENLRFVQVSFAAGPIAELRMRLDLRTIQADETPYIPAPDNKWVQASNDLGRELDITLNWSPSQYLTFTAFWGMFSAGKYYDDLTRYYDPDIPETKAYRMLSGKVVTLAELGMTISL